MFAVSVAARIAVTVGAWALGYYTGRRWHDGFRRAEAPKRFRMETQSPPQVASWIRAAMS